MTSKWRDMRKLFVKEHIVVRGCFGYGLKNIARSLKNMNLIGTGMEVLSEVRKTVEMWCDERCHSIQ